jgi:hypothetical protein
MSELVAAAAIGPKPPPRSRDATRQAWVERLARFAAAGLSTAQFCAAEGVSVASFYLWRRRLAPANSYPAATTDSDFQPRPRLLAVQLPERNATVELVLPTGAVLRIGAGADEETLRRLLRLLGVQPC